MQSVTPNNLEKEKPLRNPVTVPGCGNFPGHYTTLSFLYRMNKDILQGHRDKSLSPKARFNIEGGLPRLWLKLSSIVEYFNPSVPT